MFHLEVLRYRNRGANTQASKSRSRKQPSQIHQIQRVVLLCTTKCRFPSVPSFRRASVAGNQCSQPQLTRHLQGSVRLPGASHPSLGLCSSRTPDSGTTSSKGRHLARAIAILYAWQLRPSLKFGPSGTNAPASGRSQVCFCDPITMPPVSFTSPCLGTEYIDNAQPEINEQEGKFHRGGKTVSLFW